MSGRAAARMGLAPRGCSSMAERQLPKLIVRVRFPSPAPEISQVSGYVLLRCLSCSGLVDLPGPLRAIRGLSCSPDGSPVSRPRPALAVAMWASVGRADLGACCQEPALVQGTARWSARNWRKVVKPQEPFWLPMGVNDSKLPWTVQWTRTGVPGSLLHQALRS